MALTDSLRILITANGAQAEREFAKVGAAARRNLGQAESSSVRMGRSLTSAGVAMATFGGVALVGLYAAAQAAQEEDLAIMRLNNSMANSEELAGASADAFLAQAAALQDTTKFADDATIGVQALLGQFSLTQDQILQLTPLVLDLSSKMGISLEAAAKAVGRATQGTSGGLSRMIGQFEVGDTRAEAFAGTIDALAGKVGGFAEQEGATLNGQLAIMRNNLGDIAESLGRGAVQGFNTILGPVRMLGEQFEKMNPSSQEAVGRIATFGAAGLTAAGAVSFLAGQVLTAAERFRTLKDSITASRAAAAGWVGLAGALGYALGRISENMTGLSMDIQAIATADFGSLEEAARMLAAFGSESEIRDTIVAVGQLDAMQAQRFAGYLEDAGASSSVIRQALLEVLRSGNFENATGELAELRDATEETTREVRNLGREWQGLQGSLGQLDAQVAAGEAIYSFRDALREARRDGRITSREMLGLQGNLGDLVGAFQRSAEAQSMNADGSTNFQKRNRILRNSLEGLAAFIPAELLPTFNNLRESIRNVPTDHNTRMRVSGVDEAITQANRLDERLRQIAQNNYTAHITIMENNQVDTPGLSHDVNGERSVGGPKRRGPQPRESEADRIADRIADRLSRTTQPVMIVGGTR